MVVMHVIGLTVDNTTKTPLVVLQDDEGQEILPIWIGAMEAMAISLALSGSSLPRPLTHNLLLDILQRLGVQLEAVEITELREGTYIADLLIKQGENNYRVDSRPSDGIALAIHAGAPIRVSATVLQAAAEARLRPGPFGEARIVRPEDVATDMIRRVSHTAGTGQPETVLAQVADAIAQGVDATEDEDDKHLAELLQKMEPDSPRRM